MYVKLYVQHWYGGKVYDASTVGLETYNKSQIEYVQVYLQVTPPRYW